MVAPVSYHFNKPKDDAAVFWSHRLYRNKDGETPKIYYCKTYEQAEQQAKQFKDYPVIGFDLEWEIGANKSSSSSIKWNVSLIQIAAMDRIALFHVAAFEGDTIATLMPPSLREILESSNVTKTGVNISGDATRMRRHLHVDMKGLFELSHLYKVVQYSATEPSLVNRKLVSMAMQVKEVFGLPLLKEDSVRTGRWSKRLDMKQIDYAAADAYAGFCLYNTLDEWRRKMDPVPPRPAHYELFQPLELGNGDVVEYKPYRKRGQAVIIDDSADEEYFDALEEQEVEESEPSARDAVEDDVDSSSSYDSDMSDPDSDESDREDLSSRGSTSKARTTTKRTFTATLAIRTSSSTAKPPVPRVTPSTPTSPHLIQARSWVAAWRQGDGADCQSVSDRQLEIWHMWHRQRLVIPTVAGIARDPPLSYVTVASYAATAVKEAGLPFEMDRMREAWKLLPESFQARYGKIWEQIRQS